MSVVTLRFSGSSNFAALAVKLYTWSWCSHVETIIENPVNGKLLYGSLPGNGVSYRPLYSTKGDYVEEYEVKLPPYERHLYIEKLLSQKGKPYDFTALAGMVIHRDWYSQKKWFCSELIAWAFKEAGFPLLRTDHVNRITPENLLLSPLLRRIS